MHITFYAMHTVRKRNATHRARRFRIKAHTTRLVVTANAVPTVGWDIYPVVRNAHKTTAENRRNGRILSRCCAVENPVEMSMCLTIIYSSAFRACTHFHRLTGDVCAPDCETRFTGHANQHTGKSWRICWNEKCLPRSNVNPPLQCLVYDSRTCVDVLTSTCTRNSTFHWFPRSEQLRPNRDAKGKWILCDSSGVDYYCSRKYPILKCYLHFDKK